MSLPRVSISKRILKEIDDQIKDEVVNELAKNLLVFELENWRIEKAHFRDYFDKQITIQSKKRLQKA
jgi:hypothetical protein